MNRQALDELKQQIPLLDYLQTQDWQPTRRIRGGRLMGLCPLHADRKPSFLLDPHHLCRAPMPSYGMEPRSRS